MRRHAGHRGLGVCARELELDVLVEPFEALVAADLRAGRAEQAAALATGFLLQALGADGRLPTLREVIAPELIRRASTGDERAGT